MLWITTPHPTQGHALCIWPLQSIFVWVPGIPANSLIAIKGLAGPILLPEWCRVCCSNLSGAPELKVSTDRCKICRGKIVGPQNWWQGVLLWLFFYHLGLLLLQGRWSTGVSEVGVLGISCISQDNAIFWAVTQPRPSTAKSSQSLVSFLQEEACF